MFHIIIIDDEQTIRDGISHHIKRAYKDLSLDGSFADGKEAIDFLRHNKVDIVITDIRMSENSGIDVAKFLYENNTETKIIFLSGYQEFEYAKQAIQYNVKYYLPKPVKLSELNDALDDLLSQLADKRRETSVLEKEKQHLQNLLSIVKHDFYSDILLGILNGQTEILQRAHKIGLAESFLTQTQCAVFSMTVTNASSWRYGYDDLYTSLQNLLREIVNLETAIPIIQEKHKIVYIGEFSRFVSDSALQKSLESDLNMITQSAAEFLKIECNCEILFYGRDIFSLKNYHGLAHGNAASPVLLEDKYKDLLSRILAHDTEGAQDILNKLELYAQTLTLEDCRQLLSQLFQKIFHNLDLHLLLDLTFTQSDSQEALFNQSRELLASIAHHTAESPQDFENETIARAKQYIEEHFTEDIGLEDVAGFVYLNPVYFSRFFKQYTDMTMTDYLTRLRINRASELLREHRLKIHEISHACGYKSSKYFAKIFKQHTGLTPSEFSKINTK